MFTTTAALLKDLTCNLAGGIIAGMGKKDKSDMPELTIAIIEQLRNQGLSGAEIARMFGVTRQAVSYHRVTYNGTRTPREAVGAAFPWKVLREQCQTAPYKRLRDHGEYMATGGKGMPEYKLVRLRAFYRKLREENLVLEFDPTFPPEKGVSNKGGFRYQTRTDKDADLLIRVNKYTELTEEGRMIWRFPPVEP